jgi:hypothetical protein
MLSFPGELVLEDERVLLRPLQPADLVFLTAFAEQEPDIWIYSAVNAAGKEGMKNYVEFAMRQKGLQKEYPFIVSTKRPICMPAVRGFMIST